MIEINLPEEIPQIKINGHVFDLQMSDMDIIKTANDMLVQFAKYKEIPAGGFGVDEVIADCEKANAFIDAMLGEGATKKLSHGRPVRLQLMIKWITVVTEAVASAYAEAVMNA